MAPPLRRILVVDDEESVCHALRRVLESSGYLVSVAESGEAGLRILETTPVQVVISDNSMPGMLGIDFLKLVRVRHPNVVRIMLTGDPHPETPVRSINEGEVYRFIRKPWDNADLRTILHFAFGVVALEEEKRRLIALVRKQRQARESGSPMDPADLEEEVLLLAEEEAGG